MKRLLIILLTLLTAVACVSAVYAADGDGQSFQSVDYYCREALKGNAQSEKLLHVYDKIAEGMECSAAEIVFDDDKYDITTEELEIAMNAYRCDYAHHFWLGNTYTPWGYDSNGTLVITKIVPQYIISGAALTKAKNDLEAEAEKLLEGITPYMSEYERELLIHDRLASRIYDMVQMGFVFIDEYIKVDNADGTTSYVKRYSIVKFPDKEVYNVG